MLTREQAKAFYDRFGAKQDAQGFYEDVATRDLVAHADFEHAHALFEFGCGTGRFAAELLAERLPEVATYTGCDASTTMIGLARERLAPFGARAHLALTDGSMRLDVPDAAFDRLVSNYVLDLLVPEDIELLLAEAGRVLTPDGRLCLVSLTHGATVLSRFVSWTWARVHGMRPQLVGGCRPIELLDFLPEREWQIEHHGASVPFGIPSEVIVARKRIGAPR